MRKSGDQSVPTIPDSQFFLDQATFELITLEELKDPIVRFGTDYWLSLCGTNGFPARDVIDLREIRGVLSHTMLIKVIEDGADFEFRIVGDAVAWALRFPVQKRRLSDIRGEAPMFAERNFKFYRSVVESGSPLAIRTRFGLDSPELRYTNVEATILPLGSRDGVVDDLLAFANYISRLD
jgi:hypothetical protein